MDANEGAATSSELKSLCQLSLAQLHTLSRGLSEELLNRAQAVNPLAAFAHDCKRMLLIAAAKAALVAVELRGLCALQLSPAAPPPDSQHGAVELGPGLTLRREQPSAPGTTGGDAGDLSSRYPSRRHLFAGHDPHCPPQCPRCEEDLGHEGACRPPPGPETAPSSTSSRSANAATDAARAEGAQGEDREAGRTESSCVGRVELLQVHAPACLCGDCRARRELVDNVVFIGSRSGGRS